MQITGNKAVCYAGDRCAGLLRLRGYRSRARPDRRTRSVHQRPTEKAGHQRRTYRQTIGNDLGARAGEAQGCPFAPRGGREARIIRQRHAPQRSLALRCVILKPVRCKAIRFSWFAKTTAPKPPPRLSRKELSPPTSNPTNTRPKKERQVHRHRPARPATPS